MAELSDVQRGTPSAVAEVRRQLLELGVEGAAPILHLANSADELRSVAPEVLGDGFGNEAWFAILHVWKSSFF